MIEHDIPIGADTIFDIASASEQFTAACLLLLQRDGMLSLDEDLRRYLPELLLPVPVTLRQCLSHTSGLRSTTRCASWRACRLRAWMRRGSCACWPGRPASTSRPAPAGATPTGFRPPAAALLGEPRWPSSPRTVFGRGCAPPVSAMTSPRRFPGWPPATHPRPTAAGAGPNHRGDGRDGGVVTSVSDLAGWQRFMLTGATLGADIRDGLLGPPCSRTGGGCPTRSAWRSPRSAAAASTCIRGTSTGSGRRLPT